MCIFKRKASQRAKKQPNRVYYEGGMDDPKVNTK